MEKSLQFDAIEGNKLTALMLSANGTDLCNSSVEEGIFPNVLNYHHICVPSYQPDYDYQNEYSNTPLVYSWLPIVPGFNPDGLDNLHNFEYLSDKGFGVASSSPESTEISNQNVKYHDFLAINNSKCKLVNNSCDLENSCNAVDLNISCSDDVNQNPDLSFIGKITELKAVSAAKLQGDEVEGAENVAQTDDQRVQNESFEFLKREDSSKMLYINEKSPELFNRDGEVISDNEVLDMPAAEHSSKKLPENSDGRILKKLQKSLAGICPPPSVTTKWSQMSLSEMLSTYHKNSSEATESKTDVNFSSFFIPSCTTNNAQSANWPNAREIKCLDVNYNKSSHSEDIEVLCLRYGERFVAAQTISSFNNKVGPSSAKKKTEKLK